MRASWGVLRMVLGLEAGHTKKKKNYAGQPRGDREDPEPSEQARWWIEKRI